MSGFRLQNPKPGRAGGRAAPLPRARPPLFFESKPAQVSADPPTRRASAPTSPRGGGMGVRSGRHTLHPSP